MLAILQPILSNIAPLTTTTTTINDNRLAYIIIGAVFVGFVIF